ncbi:hypothetical protein KR018_004506 [Drosophila ironensis]|nr:hypothetical protein KR018_004506 [Drosophila ironensis]
MFYIFALLVLTASANGLLSALNKPAEKAAYLKCLDQEMGIKKWVEVTATVQQSKCGHHCLMIAAGFIKDGKIDEKAIRKETCSGLLKDSRFKKIEAKCYAIKETSKCGLGSRFLDCIYHTKE